MQQTQRNVCRRDEDCSISDTKAAAPGKQLQLQLPATPGAVPPAALGHDPAPVKTSAYPYCTVARVSKITVGNAEHGCARFRAVAPKLGLEAHTRAEDSIEGKTTPGR